MSQNQDLFFNQLKDIFIGAEINGQSGFINLMKIKSSYFDWIFEELLKEINDKTSRFPEFKEELFNKLYSFFKTYFSESGSIYFSYTPLKSNVFERIYSNQRDVVLFWKTHMLYYIKSERLWNNLTLVFNNNALQYKINFDVSKLAHKSANEKKEIIYELQGITDKEVTFYVLYSEKGKTTKTDDIIKSLKESKVILDEVELSEIFRIFEKQNEVDFFINKDAQRFLKEQFNLWLKNYLFDDESDFTEKRLNQLKVLKAIAYSVIDFVAQFEDELVKIWKDMEKIDNKIRYFYSINNIL